MNKLIAQCQAAPTEKNIAKLAAYLRKHPMAACMATPEQIAFINANIK